MAQWRGRDEAVRGGVGGDERVGADAGAAAARQRQRFVNDACCMSLFASGRGTYLEAMANRSVSEERSTASQTRTVAVPVSSIVDGEMTRAVHVIGILMASLVAGAILAGVWKASAGPQSGKAALVMGGLFLTEVILAAILILLGSVVEGFGYGLSLGTRWPYTRNILVLMVQGDPEAAHRLVATLVGLIALALVVLAPSSATINGLALVIIAALFGIGTLHVLSGRMPAFVHGIHGLLAYGVFLSAQKKGLPW
jgi:heme A synthase